LIGVLASAAWPAGCGGSGEAETQEPAAGGASGVSGSAGSAGMAEAGGSAGDSAAGAAGADAPNVDAGESDTSAGGGAEDSAGADAAVDAGGEGGGGADATGEADAAGGDSPADGSKCPGGGLTVKKCFEAISKGIGPDYDQYCPVVGSHCLGTNHQKIAGVQDVVFLGDSVTEGTPPSLWFQYFRNVLETPLKAKFGSSVTFRECSAWGARTDDLLEGQKQITQCWPSGHSDKTTLVIFTAGGNDISNWATNELPLAQAMIEADKAADLLQDAVRWFKEPGRFPNGVFVIYADPYEFTDATGDMWSCPAAAAGGVFFGAYPQNYFQGANAVIHFVERYMQIAVDQKVDMIFSLAHFCGHGFHNEDPASQCYRGPGTERWFDLTCIHPTPKGHQVLADMFMAVVNE
jgi:lysophospholipase L1-like esterase